MDRERKKRKKDDNNAEEAEEAEEEEKMEKFFALIRSTRDVRERMAMMSNVDRLKLEEEEKKKANDKQAGVWNPTFQPEDFIEDNRQLSISPPQLHPSTIKIQEAAGPSNSKREDDKTIDQDDKTEGDHDLDLRLSL
ncbi:hypothetical protein ACH5RR_001690 [Cinchona calisaya]|uniref:Uncharacterized protein n=1 Tax=Cinchona calisaya TaxID=153742 RepID=A0ABD3B5E6_9GENT